MNRRAFLRTLIVSTLAAPLAKFAAPEPFIQGLRFHRDAFALAMAPLPVVDVLWGWSTVRPEWAARIVDDSPKRLQWHERNFDPARLPA